MVINNDELVIMLRQEVTLLEAKVTELERQLSGQEREFGAIGILIQGPQHVAYPDARDRLPDWAYQVEYLRGKYEQAIAELEQTNKSLRARLESCMKGHGWSTENLAYTEELEQTVVRLTRAMAIQDDA